VRAGGAVLGYVTSAELARVRADLAEARHRREELEHRWAVTKHTSSGTDDPAALDVELARVDATIAELEERLAGSLSGVEGASPAPERPRPPTHAPDGQAEFLDVRAAAALLGTTPKALEGMRRRGTGPAYVRHGKRVRYRRADLLSTVQETVQGVPSKPPNGI
jgi:hypothetical protein